MSTPNTITPFDDASAIDAALALGLNQRQLADLLGVSPRHLSKCRHGYEGKQLGPSARRLVQAYLDGYRPADWPL